MSDRTAETLWTGAGLVDAGHRIVWAGGADAISFLHDLLSQDIAGLQDGRSARSLLLAPNGRLRAVIVATHIGDRVALISRQAEHVLDDLSRFRIRVDVELSLDPRPSWLLWGPAGDAAMARAGWPTAPDAWDDGSRLAVRDPTVGQRWIVAGDLEDMAVGIAHPDAVRARRIEVGEAEFGIDIDESTLPNEAFDLAEAVDFQKGCYLGQELVERIDARGRLVKRLTGIVFEGGLTPPAGVALSSEETQVGTATSTAFSPMLGRPIGLGMIRTEVEDGREIVASWDSGTAKGVVTQPPLLTIS